MRRDHKFENLEEVKAELETSVKQFAPKRELKDIPYLSLGADVGQRTICFEGNSDISGSFVIEDVEIDGHTHRRLVFLSNEFLTQSEARLKSGEFIDIFSQFYLRNFFNYSFLPYSEIQKRKDENRSRPWVFSLWTSLLHEHWGDSVPRS